MKMLSSFALAITLAFTPLAGMASAQEPGAESKEKLGEKAEKKVEAERNEKLEAKKVTIQPPKDKGDQSEEAKKRAERINKKRMEMLKGSGAKAPKPGDAEVHDGDHSHDEHAHGDHAHSEMDLPQKGVCILVSRSDSKVNGNLVFMQKGKDIQLRGQVRKLTPGKHGFHIHQFGDLRGKDGKAAGGHYNPEGTEHCGPNDKHSHVGDLGNIEADDKGVAKVDITIPDTQLHFLLGRSMVVHAEADDLKSQPSGDAGGRVAVGVIGIANPEFKPMRGKNMKKAGNKQAGKNKKKSKNGEAEALVDAPEELEEEVDEASSVAAPTPTASAPPTR